MIRNSIKFSVCLLLVMAVVVTPLLSQDKPSEDWLKILSYGVSNQTAKTNLSPKEVLARKGQCLPDLFTKANLTLGNGAVINNLKIKYDYKEHIILIQQQEQTLIAAPNMVREIVFIGDPRYTKFINTSEPGRSYGRVGFYEVILETEGNFLVSYRSFEENQSYAHSGIRDNEAIKGPEKQPTYRQKKEFLLFKSQKAYIIENFKSGTLSQFDELSGNLKAYVKQEKLKFRNEEDLKKFAQYYWSL